jgi:hypothetical protein
VHTHVKVIGVLFIIGGVVLVGLAFFTNLLLRFLAGVVNASAEEGAAVGAAVLGMTGAMLSAFFFLLAVPYVVTGWGLLKFRRWARIVGIVLAAIALTKFPLGTVFGIYALVILFRKDTEELFAT